MHNFGVVWFKDFKNPSNGWSCLPNQPPKTIGNISDLPTDTVWVSNLPYMTIKENSLYTLPNIRENNYFRLSLQNIAEDLGLTSLSPDAICEQVCDLLYQVTQVLEKVLETPCSFPDYRFSQFIKPLVLPTDFALSPMLPDMDPMMSEYAFKNATQINQGMSGLRFPKGSRSTRFRTPRYHHYKWIIANGQFPSSNDWQSKNIPNASKVIGPRDIEGIQWWKDMSKTHCGIVSATISNINASAASYCTPGVIGARGAPSRKWFSVVDILMLSEIATVNVSTAYTCPAKAGISDKVVDATLELSEICGDGYVSGLCMHLIMASLLDGVSNEGTAIGMQLSSIDRSLLSRSGAILRNSNHVVGSYSSGGINAFCKPSNIDSSDLAITYSHVHTIGLLPAYSNAKAIANSPFMDINREASTKPFSPLPQSYIEDLKASAEFISIRSLIEKKDTAISQVRKDSL